MNPNSLRQRAAETTKKARALLDLAATENRDLSPEEQETYDTWISNAERDIRQAKMIEDIETKIGGGPSEREGRTTPAPRTQVHHEQPQTLEILQRPENERNSLRIRSIVPAFRGSEQDKRHSFADFLHNVGVRGDREASVQDRDKALDILTNQYRSKWRDWTKEDRSRETRAMAANTGTTGGFIVPAGFYENIMSVAAPMSLVRPKAFVLPMDLPEMNIPMLDQTTAQTAGLPAYFGGLLLNWTGEGKTINSTQPAFRQAKLTAHELTGYIPVNRTLVYFSPISVEALIYQLFGGAVAWWEDYNFFRGDGDGKPLGVLNAPCRIKTAARASSTALGFQTDIVKVWVKVMEDSQEEGEWYASKGIESQVYGMTGTANSVFIPSGYYIAGEDTNAAGLKLRRQILGQRVNITAKLPYTADTDGDFNFFDFRYYIIGDPGEMEIGASEHYLYANNQITYRVVHRVGGMPWLNNPITMEDGTSQISPFVSLGVV